MLRKNWRNVQRSIYLLRKRLQLKNEFEPDRSWTLGTRKFSFPVYNKFNQLFKALPRHYGFVTSFFSEMDCKSSMNNQYQCYVLMRLIADSCLFRGFSKNKKDLKFLPLHHQAHSHLHLQVNLNGEAAGYVSPNVRLFIPVPSNGFYTILRNVKPDTLENFQCP